MKKVILAGVLLLALILAVFGTIAFINYHRTFIFLDGSSMEPTIKSGQEVRVHKYVKGQLPKREDIVEYSSTNKLVKQNVPSEKLIHRIIALPGERIIISNNKVLVYDAQQPNGFDPDITYPASKVVTSGTVDLTLGPHTYFIMGDNKAQCTGL